MAIKASNQVTLIDLTDAYAVNLSNDSHTFQGTTNTVNGTQTITSRVTAMCGSEKVSCSVGEISSPTGISIVSDGKAPEPTLTITATSALTAAGTVDIPVQIGDDITIVKTFSYSIAFKGTNGANGTSVTVSSTSVTYQTSTSGTTTPTGNWLTAIPSVPAGQYLWTKTTVTYSDGKSTTAYAVSRNAVNGTNGTSVTVSSTAVTYQVGTNGTTAPTGTWNANIPSTTPGQYLWTRTVVTYSDGKSTTSYAVSRNGSNGTNGANGADAVTLVITSSGGFIFKNTAIATTLTAHVYKAGTELTGSALTAQGTIKWYKDGGTTAIATGTTLNITAGAVANSANYTAQLE